MVMGRPKGSLNKDKPWAAALRKAVAKRDGNQPKKLERIAERVADDALDGGVAAMKEVPLAASLSRWAACIGRRAVAKSTRWMLAAWTTC